MIPATQTSLAVGERVDVDLDRVLEEAVEQQRVLLVGLDVLLQVGVRGPRSSNRSPSPGRRARRRAGPAAGSRPPRRSPPPPRPRARCRRAGARSPSRRSRAPKRPRSSARSIASTGVPSSGTPASSSAPASFSGVWPPNWTITPSGCSSSTDGEHVLGGQRLEVEAVGGVVVGRDRLRVAVDHHRVAARARARSSPRARSSSRTRSPGRSGSGRSRGSRPRPSPRRPRRPRPPLASGRGRVVARSWAE